MNHALRRCRVAQRWQRPVANVGAKKNVVAAYRRAEQRRRDPSDTELPSRKDSRVIAEQPVALA